MTSAIAAARALHAALEAGQYGAALRPLFTEGVTVTEHPNAVRPRGASIGLDAILRDSENGATLLQKQTYRVHSAVEQGDTAALRLTWTAVVARDVGPFRSGQVLVAHIAQFVRVESGRIAHLETFDCYEPFA